MRRDAARSRRRLLQAAGRLLATERPFTLAEVAGEAGVGTATAYRHFPSAEAVVQAYVAGFLDDVEARLPAGEVELLAFCRLWVEAVLDWGPALVHLRSAEGFLARRARGEAEVVRSLRALEPALRRHVPGEEELTYALGVWNALADPREVLDQVATLGWSAERIAERLHAAVLAAV